MPFSLAGEELDPSLEPLLLKQVSTLNPWFSLVPLVLQRAEYGSNGAGWS